MGYLKGEYTNEEIQKLYAYYMSQVGYGPYQSTPPDIKGLEKHFGSLDKTTSVINNNTSPVINSPVEAAVNHARYQLKRERDKLQRSPQKKSKPKRTTPKRIIPKKRRERDLFDSE